MDIGTYGRVTQHEHLTATANALEESIVRIKHSQVFTERIRREMIATLLAKVNELRQRAILAGHDERQGRLM